MKKIIIIILLSVLLLCSCEKKEYNLIELNGKELLDFLTNVKGDIVLAFTDEHYEKNDEFLENLEKVAHNAHENIYYVNSNHISAMNDLVLYEYFGIDMIGLHYYALEGGKEVVSESYLGSYVNLFKDLKGKDYNTTINFLSDEEKESTINEAKKLYENGFVGQSLDYINSVWNTDEAKKMYSENKYYKIIESWECQKEEKDTINYTSLLFTAINNQVYYFNETYNADEFEKPEIDEYDVIYYKIMNNKLYVSDYSDGEYEGLFDIDYLDNDTLVLSDKNNKKTFKLKS